MHSNLRDSLANSPTVIVIAIILCSLPALGFVKLEHYYFRYLPSQSWQSSDESEGASESAREAPKSIL